MSHAPETSLSSRELAEQVLEFRTYTKGIGIVDYPDKAAALIDAWVRVREADAKIEQAKITLAVIVASGAVAIEDRRSQILTALRSDIGDLESALATAHKQLRALYEEQGTPPEERII